MIAATVNRIRVGDLIEVHNAGRRYRFRVDIITYSGILIGPRVSVKTGAVIFRQGGTIQANTFHAAATVIAPGVRTLAEAYAENRTRAAVTA